jgi:glycine cleavage system H protein
MASKIPDDLRYTKEHEWAKSDGELIAIGITDHAQSQLGDVVFLELPDVGATLEADGAFGVVESVKAVSDLFAPIAGEVAEINEALVDAPETVNQDPYGEAWMVKIKPADANALDSLMDASGYAKFLEEEAK